MNRQRRPDLRRPHGLPWIAVPITAYLVVTLAVPLANGAVGSPRFIEHVLTTLLVSGLIGLGLTLSRIRR